MGPLTLEEPTHTIPLPFVTSTLPAASIYTPTTHSNFQFTYPLASDHGSDFTDRFPTSQNPQIDSSWG